ncbi:BT_3044 domain-containing protein [Gaoshiqia sp. Z1-71]|uniref:BT_3044 domain-containing protein n=1 Tax=Gaoshiqia hydrogeniformans TaxID=3290090 RepID=UPI003BF85315
MCCSKLYKTKSDGSNDSGNKLTVAVKSLYALSDRQCYFYAGQFDRTSLDRDLFIVDLSLSDDNEVSFSSPNTGINLTMEEGTVEVNTVDHTTDNRYTIVTTTLKLKYTFIDVSSSDQPVLRAEGTISMNQQALKDTP